MCTLNALCVTLSSVSNVALYPVAHKGWLGQNLKIFPRLLLSVFCWIESCRSIGVFCLLHHKTPVLQVGDDEELYQTHWRSRGVWRLSVDCCPVLMRDLLLSIAAWFLLPETMLLVAKDLVLLEEVYQMAMDDVLEDFAADRREWHWSIVCWLALVALLEDRGNVCLFPFVRYPALYQWCLEYKGQHGSARGSTISFKNLGEKLYVVSGFVAISALHLTVQLCNERQNIFLDQDQGWN